MGIFDELEAVGAHRIVGADCGRRRVVRKRTHAKLPLRYQDIRPPAAQLACK
jgi:hypothetical protein